MTDIQGKAHSTCGITYKIKTSIHTSTLKHLGSIYEALSSRRNSKSVWESCCYQDNRRLKWVTKPRLKSSSSISREPVIKSENEQYTARAMWVTVRAQSVGMHPALSPEAPVNRLAHLLNIPLEFKTQDSGTSLVVQPLRLCASKAGGASSIPGWGTKISQATWWGWIYRNTHMRV